MSCLSSGRVKKLQKFINLCLKVGHGANLKGSKSTWRHLIILRQNITSKALGTMHAQHFLIAEQEWLIYDSCCFDVGRFHADQQKRPHLSDTFAYCSAHNNLFLMLLVIQKLKIRSKTVVCNTACYVTVERLYPVFKSKRTKVKQVKDLKKEILLNRIKGFFQVGQGDFLLRYS